MQTSKMVAIEHIRESEEVIYITGISNAMTKEELYQRFGPDKYNRYIYSGMYYFGGKSVDGKDNITLCFGEAELTLTVGQRYGSLFFFSMVERFKKCSEFLNNLPKNKNIEKSKVLF